MDLPLTTLFACSISAMSAGMALPLTHVRRVASPRIFKMLHVLIRGQRACGPADICDLQGDADIIYRMGYGK